MDTQTDTHQADWRVRLKLAPEANYLYKSPGITSSHVLYPLVETNGVIFPYTPQITVSYSANYDATDLTHSNYKLYQYKNSDVGQVSITCDFTAQDTAEAEYVLATMFFFKSLTKMFYGQDSNPQNGTPPPLCFLSGLGPLQFNNHPLVITNFSPTYPNDVDYIRCKSDKIYTNATAASSNTAKEGFFSSILSRLTGANLAAGGKPPPPLFQEYATASLASSSATYIPTKMSMQIQCLPIISRDAMSNVFSLTEYSSGKLNSKGIW